jgi:hypothetical protein
MSPAFASDGLSTDIIRRCSECPEWACLDCEPGWAEVHHLGLEEEKLQDAKNVAVQSCDFEAAATLYNRQDEINDRIVERVRRLTSPPLIS